MTLQEFSKNKENLDGVSSASFAELYLRFDVAVAFGTLYGAFNFGEDIFGFAELLPEMLVIE